MAMAGSCSHNTSVTAAEAQSSELQDEDIRGFLPDELLERVLAVLPVTNIIRARGVCKRWNSIIASTSFLHLCEEGAATSPWYFMCNDSFAGVAYDPVAEKWHNFELPRIDTPKRKRFVASVNGLVCLLDSSDGCDLYICNPMTKATRKLPERSHQQSKMCDYSVSMTVNKATKVLTTVVARHYPMPDNILSRTLSIEIYDSLSKEWRTAAETTILGWMGFHKSVICNGVFYCVSVSSCTGIIDNKLITYQLSSGVLKVASLEAPCILTHLVLMNCNNKVVMVGGIGTGAMLEGIGIWELDTEWREVAKMPSKYFERFRNTNYCYTSSGSGDLIYIHVVERPHLFLYDMSRRSWRPPMVKRDLTYLLTGFCFEPRLEACA